MFEVFFDIPAQDFVERADENTHSRVRETLEELALDPVPRGRKKNNRKSGKIIPFSLQTFKVAL